MRKIAKYFISIKEYTNNRFERERRFKEVIEIYNNTADMMFKIKIKIYIIISASFYLLILFKRDSFNFLIYSALLFSCTCGLNEYPFSG